MATPVMGRLGDMYGKRRLLLVSLGLMVIGSVVAALSSALAPFIVGRVLQGLAGGVIPLGISIMRDTLPAERLGAATATMSSSLGVGGALGLPAAALIADHVGWHLLFWISAALGAVAGGLVLAVVPDSPVRTGGRFDLVGAAGLSVALVCLLLAISKGAAWGWGSGLTLALFGIAVGVLLVWGWWELRTRQPLVDLRTTARRQVLTTNLASIMFGFSMFGMSLVLPQQLVLVTCVVGAGIGFAYGAMPALVMAAVPMSETAAANSLNTLMRAIGTSISSAVAGVILAQLTLTIGTATVPSPDGFRIVLAIGAGAALVALAIASFLPGRKA